MRDAIRALVVFATGVGGLAIETVAVRRHALVLGGTASASAYVLGVFLAGLGLGSFLAARWGRAEPVRRPLVVAGAAYALVALTALVGDRLVVSASDGLGATAFAPALLHPGATALAMGFAFPFVLAGTGRAVAAALLATNLLGSVVSAWAAGNVWIPGIGLGRTNALATSAYAAAAVLLVAFGRTVVAAPSASGRDVVAENGPGEGGVDGLPMGTLAFLAGFATLGYEIVLLHRLPYFLEGFQPTLSAVLAASLATLAAGGYVAAWLARSRSVSRGAVLGGAGLVAALFVSAPFLDPVAGRFAFVAVSSDFGFHARALTTAAAVAAPVLVPLGVVLPTLVAREHGRPGSDRTGILLAFHGLGNLAGAIAVGWLLPRFGVPVSATLTKALLAAVCVTIAWRATWGRLASGRLVPATLVVAPFALSLVFPAAGPFVGTRNDRANLDILADATDAHGTATVAYDRQNHAMVLFTDEFRAAETGPGTGYMRVLGHLPKLILQDAVAGGGSGARIAVIALGTGTTANALAAWPDHEVLHVVEISRAVLELAPWFSGDGPLAIRRDDPRPAWQRDPRTRVHCTDGRRWLAAAGDEEEALDLVTMEPLLPYDPGTAALYSREFYRLVHDRLRPGGLCVQWIPTHAMPADTFRTLLRTFAAEFDPVSVWLVDQATLLVGIRGGGDTAPDMPTVDRLAELLASAPQEARQTMHEAGLCDAADFRAALVVERLDPAADALREAPVLSDDRPFLERIGYWSGAERLGGFLADNLAVLDALVGDEAGDDAPLRRSRLAGRRELALAPLTPGPAAPRAAVARLRAARALAPSSTLLHQEETRARRLEVEAALVVSERAAAARLAGAWLRRDPASARVWLAAGFGGGEPEQQAAVRAAVAVDPTLWSRGAVRVAADVEVTRPQGELVSPLAAIDVLGGDERLAGRAAGEDGVAWSAALRAAWPVRSARALIERRRRGDVLSGGAAEALRSVLDPASFREFAGLVLEPVATDAADAHRRLQELGVQWRSDLPMPDGLVAWVRSPVPEVRAEAAAVLAERRASGPCRLLAGLLRDDVLEVRQAAGIALFRTWGDRFRYDPEGTAIERDAVASALEQLHDPGR
jgi:spermidine synthase